MPYSPPYRTTVPLVMGVLLSDYDTVNNPDLTPFIQVASVMVDQVVSMAIKKQYNPINRPVPTGQQQELIERFLAAHFYTMSDRQYKSKSTGGASGNFSPNYEDGFCGSTHGQMAVRIDPSGCLRNIDKQQFASAIHIGTNGCGFLPFPGIGDFTSLPFVGGSEGAGG